MNVINVDEFQQDISFKIKTESYLYITASKMLEFHKGDIEKVKEYMNDRIKIIENLTGTKRPFKVEEKGETILEVT